MKAKIEPLDRVYNKCLAEGIFRDKTNIDIELIKSLLESAEIGIKRLSIIGDKFEKDSGNYAYLLRDNYEILRMLIDAFIYFDKKAISNHQCNNAYLCTEHPELDFDWEILETMRFLRNAVNYEGMKVSIEQWNKIKLPFKIYIQSLQMMIKNKLKD